MNNIRYSNLKTGGLIFDVEFVKVYAPGEPFDEFNEKDIDEGTVRCNRSKWITRAACYRTLWRITTCVENLLDKIHQNEIDNISQYILDNTDIVEDSKNLCGQQSNEIVLYYYDSNNYAPNNNEDIYLICGS